MKNERPELTDIAQNTEPKESEQAPAQPVGRHSRTASRSKPATPLTTAFSEGTQLARPRSTRNNGAGSPTVGPPSPRRAQKKTTNGTSALTSESLRASQEPEQRRQPRKQAAGDIDDAPDTAGEEIDDNEENEQRYCFCNGVSFGSMVACDNNTCPREWFHLECVALAKAPTGSWFCSEQCRKEASSRRPR